MKRVFKLSLLLLSLVVIISGAVLADNFNETGYPVVDEKITISIMGTKAPVHGDWSKMFLFQEMEELTNIHPVFETPARNAYEERKKLAFASGDYPDVFFAGRLTSAEEVTYGSQGILVPLEDLIDKYAPNIKAAFEKYPRFKPSVTAPDGHIYALPALVYEDRARTPKVWLNGDWLDNLGVEELPSTTDELYNLLKRFREEDANQNGEVDEVPLSAYEFKDLRSVLAYAFGEPIRLWNQPAVGFRVVDDEVVFSFVRDGYKEYLRFLNKLYEEKLLDNEINLHTPQQYRSKGASSRMGSFPGAVPHGILGVPAHEAVNHPLLPTLTSSFTDNPQLPLNVAIRRGAFAITNKNENPEATIRWVDYLYSKQGSSYGVRGKEGLHWEYTDEDKGLWDYTVPEGMGLGKFRGTITPDVGEQIPVIKDELDESRDNVGIRYVQDEVKEKQEQYGADMFPLIYFTSSEQEELNFIMADIETYIEEMEAKFIVGRESLDNWDNYVATLNGMGLDKVLNIYQEAYDRYQSKN